MLKKRKHKTDLPKGLILLCFFVVKKTLNNLCLNPIFIKKKTVNRFVKIVKQFIRGFSEVISFFNFSIYRFGTRFLTYKCKAFAQSCIEVASFQFLQNQFGS